jgi:MFS family permease
MTCSQGLNLGQIPEVRGSIMSMVSGFSSTGRLIGLALSGWLLVVLGWSLMSLIISLFSLTSGIIVLTQANEPVTSAIE